MSTMRLFSLLLTPLLAMYCMAQEDVRPTKLFERYDPNKVTAVVDTPATDTVVVDTAQNAILGTSGDVNVIVDPRIERLMEQHAEYKHLRPGYRVQIFLGARPMAEEHKRGFLQKYPEIPIYMSWLAPNFRLRAGDLRTRLEAENLLKQLKTDYPGSYIVRDDIEMPRSIAGNDGRSPNR